MASILVVDDDALVRELVRGVLESAGHRVRTVDDGFAALRAVAAERPDCVVLDIMMPGMDGYETTRAIRERPSFRALPIIALTAKAMKGDRELSVQAGASDYITKPVDIDQLLSLMRVWLYR